MKILGDPHMGKKFRTGVPLHRVGDREATQWADLENSLLGKQDGGLHVCMGDIFDSFIVPPEIVLSVADMYRATDPKTQFILLRGNHDASRNTHKMSSFDILEALLWNCQNVTVVNHEPVVVDNKGFVPYDPFTPAQELVRGLPDNLDAVFGHWDVVDFGGQNVIPTKTLASKGILKVYTGHDHVARELKRDGVSITVTGSMQPYSHAEDPEHKLYITLPLEDLDQRDLTNMNVRVLLHEGESLPEGLDCLSLIGKRIMEEEEMPSMAEFDGLDVEQQLKKVLNDNPAMEPIMQFFEEVKNQ